MICHHVEQGSADWLTLRLGKPTASEFHRIVTPGGKFSKQSHDYAIRLVTEALLNRSLETMQMLEWVERGKDLEPMAVRAYEFREDAETAAIGFVTTDCGRIGCSPDRLVGDRGLLEIKCPAPQTHIGYLLDGPGNDYRPQIQGQLYVTERDYCDFWSFSPEMPGVLIRTGRDEPYIRLLAEALTQFIDALDQMTERVRASGYFAERAAMLSPVDAMAAAHDAAGAGKYRPGSLAAALAARDEDPFGLPPLQTQPAPANAPPERSRADIRERARAAGTTVRGAS